MRAYETRGGGFDGIVAVERPRPTPGAGQVLLRMTAAALNYRDLLIAKGAHVPGRPAVIALCDGVGEVVEMGEGVDRVRLGDRVTSTYIPDWVAGRLGRNDTKTSLGASVDGVLAEYVVLNAHSVVPVPEHLTDEEAATLPCAAVTAWNALFETGDVRAGDTVLVQGTGGVSIFALQFARLAGARVLVTSSSDAKLVKASALGASNGVNYRTTPDWDRWAIDATNGAGVDHVVEVGGPGTIGRSINALRAQGDISLIGVLTGMAGQVPVIDLLVKHIRVLGIYIGSREMFERMNQAVTLHRLRPVVDQVFPFDRAIDAFRHLESGNHFGKVVIRIAA